MIARRMRSAWLVPIVVAAIAFGYFGSTIALTAALQEPVLNTDPGVPSPDLPVANSSSAVERQYFGRWAIEPEGGGCVVRDPAS